MNEDQADNAAVAACENYLRLGLVSIVIRTTDDGNVRIIGPQLPPQSIAHMLRTAATAYEETAPKVSTN